MLNRAEQLLEAPDAALMTPDYLQPSRKSQCCWCFWIVLYRKYSFWTTVLNLGQKLSDRFSFLLREQCCSSYGNNAACKKKTAVLMSVVAVQCVSVLNP